MPAIAWSHSQGAHRALVKLPWYGGGTLLEPYLAQVWLAAQYSCWEDDEAAVQLALALEGPTVQVLLNLAPVDQTSLEGLITSLERRFGQHQSADESREHLANCYQQDGEHLGALAADVWLHTHSGYPWFSPADQEDLALYAFLRAQSPEHLLQHVRLAAPRSLDDALQKAEAIYHSQATPQRGPSAQPHIRVAGHNLGEEDEDDGDGEPVCRVPPSVPQAQQ